MHKHVKLALLLLEKRMQVLSHLKDKLLSIKGMYLCSGAFYNNGFNTWLNYLQENIVLYEIHVSYDNNYIASSSLRSMILKDC